MALERSPDLNVQTADETTRPSGWARWLRFRKHNESSEEESVRSAIQSAEEFDELTRRSGRGLWLRFRKHRLSLLGIGILAIFAIGSIFAPWLSFHDQNRVDLDNIKGAPSVEHFLGTDSAGRDVWARLLFGSRVTLVIAACALIIGVLIGTVIGMTSGYFGGWIDNVLMRFTELIMTFPTLFALIILVAILGGSMLNIMWIIGVLGWTGVARLVRGQVLAIREMDYVVAAGAIGASDRRILISHILPSTLPYIAVAGTLGLASAILIEAALNFLGLGVQIPTPTWGNMMTSAQSIHVIQNQPWLWVPPGLSIALTVLAVNFVGDGLRDALDPRIQID